MDATTGATLATHVTQTVSWDLKNAAGTTQAAGTYTIRGEMNESSTASKTASTTLTVTN